MLPDFMKHEPASSEVFAALGDPTRRHLLDQLAKTGPSNASVLADDYPLSRQAIVKHLGVLQAAGVLTSERHGNEVRYSVVPGALDDATSWLQRVGGQWDQRLVALRKHVRDR
jgi:DNA-binding transcriptional ArsR family regulator